MCRVGVGKDKSYQPTSVTESNDISLHEVLLLASVICALVLVEVLRAGDLRRCALGWLDNESYIQIGQMIRDWRIEHVHNQHFWGLPAAIALLSKLTGSPVRVSLLLVSLISSFSALTVITRLYGGVVATAFAILSLEWTHVSVMGGSEPLFLAVLMVSFLAFRAKRLGTASLLAALATTVRPVGVFALLSFGFLMIARKQWADFLKSSGIGVCIGFGYFATVRALTGDPLVNFRLYAAYWGGSHLPVSEPLSPLIRTLWLETANSRWTTSIQSIFFLTLAAACVTIIIVRRRVLFSTYPAEFGFVVLYLIFLSSYNSPELAGALPRFLIPVLPSLLFSLRHWIPRDRRILWPMTALSGLLASVQFVGFKALFGFSVHH